MSSKKTPTQTPYSRHVFFCSGRYCDPTRKSAELYNKLPGMLGEMGNYYNPERIKRGITPCLGVCSAGPLLVVYPDGTWYHHVDEALLQRIVDEHLIDGVPVQEAIFHELNADQHELTAPPAP